MAMMAPLQRMKSTRLGRAKWTDPERRQSIKDDTRVKMEWRFRTPLHIMKCWVPLQPARPCLLEAMEKVEILLQERNHEVWDGENTSPGCSYDAAMHGRSVNDAQPAVIFCSTSKICRRNAENIITNEDIPVDPRGIGMEYYGTGPDFFASGPDDVEEVELGRAGLGMFPSVSTDLRSSSKRSSKSASSSHKSNSALQSTYRLQQTACRVNGSLITVLSTSFTLGGLICIDGELYGLTVAHPFEKNGILNDDSRPATVPVIHHPDAGTIGSLLEKRCNPVISSKGQRDLDWALCLLDRAKVHLTNNISLPDGTILYPTQIAMQNPSDTEVWVHTGTTGLVKGFLTGAYSLVALPGSRTFQRMWIVVLDRLIRPGDCGSWVIDSTNGLWYGQIIAAKSETAVAYIVLARDIFRDIRDQFGGRHVRMPIESDFVSEAVSVVKRELSLSGSKAQGCLQQDSTRPCLSGKGKKRVTIPTKSKKPSLRTIRLMRRLDSSSSWSQATTAASIEIESREVFQQTAFHTAMESEYEREWYARYLEGCFREQFEHCLLPTIAGLDQRKLSASSIGQENIDVVYRFLATLVKDLSAVSRELSISDIVDRLSNGPNHIIKDSEDGTRTMANAITLMAIGWLTMSMPHPAMTSSDGLKYEGREVTIDQQDLGESSDQPLSRLLMRFNLFNSRLDPPPLYKAHGQAHASQYFIISTISFHTLRKEAQIEIIWTEQLPLHLKFDRIQKTLTLFAFPSFVRMQCRGKSKTILAQVLQEFYSRHSNSDIRTTPTGPSAEDICREILLSYRLIFGLDLPSRRLFNRECVNDIRLSSDFDPLLNILCGQKWDSPSSKPIFAEIGADPPASFYLTSDFPVFGQQLFELHDFIQTQHPSSIRTLWEDRRNTTQWYTFWVVVMIVGMIIGLGLLQTSLQIWQLVLVQQQLN